MGGWRITTGDELHGKRRELGGVLLLTMNMAYSWRNSQTLLKYSI